MPRKRAAPKSNGEQADAQKSRSSKKSKGDAIKEEEDFVLQISDAEENDEEELVQSKDEQEVEMNIIRKPKRLENEEQSFFIGEPIDADEAKRRWPDRYLAEVYFLRN